MNDTSKNVDKTMQEQLEQLGLETKEALVYLALLRLGTVGTSKLIEATGLHGQYVYQALSALEYRGLAAHAVIRGRKKFHANHPKTLVHVAEEQIRRAQEVVQQLQKQHLLPVDSVFEVYQGQESFIAHEEELLHHATSNSELLVIGGAGDRFVELMGTTFGSYELSRRKKNISVRYLGSQDQQDKLKKERADRFLFQARVLPGSFTGLVNTNIWSDTVNLNTFATPITSFVLRSAVVAESYRSFFETVWQIAK